MAKTLDVYRDWLGIAETARPLDYYQLLRLARFEDDSAKIRAHYRKMNTHVRKYAAGELAKQSQELLNELAKAMLCLTDAQRKGEYDATLGRADAGQLRRRTFEEILLANKLLDREQLEKARNYAKAVGLDIRDAVLQQKLAAPDAVMLAYAESIGLPYVDLEDVGVDEQLAPQIAPTMARQHSFVPIMADHGQLLMASPNPIVPDVEEELRLRFGMPVRSVLCTPASINVVVTKYYPPDAVQAAPMKTAPKQQAAAKSTSSAPVREPLSPEERSKRQRNAAILTFNFTVIATVVAMRFVTGYMSLGSAGLGVVLGIAAAGIAFFMAGRQ